MMSTRNVLWRPLCLGAILSFSSVLCMGAVNPPLPLLNEPKDVSGDFRDFSNLYYLADRVVQFDPASASGRLCWWRAQYQTRQAFDNMLAVIRPVPPNEFPGREYEPDPNLPFSIEFVSPRTLRIRATSGPQFRPDGPSLMLVERQGPAGRVLEDEQGRGRVSVRQSARLGHDPGESLAISRSAMRQAGC